MSKVLKIVKFLSIVIFLLIILSVYAYLPEQTALFIDDSLVSKEVFFYSALILFFVINFLFSALGFLYKRNDETDTKKQRLKEWLLSLPVAINFYLIFMVAYIGVINNQSSFDPGTYTYLLYLGPLLLLIWLIALLRIMFTPATPAV